MKIAGFFLAIFVIASLIYAGGLSSNWGEIVINGVEPSMTYDLNEITGAPFKITNNFEDEIIVNLEALIPKQEELKEGYEPVPDTSWLIVQNQVTLKPKEQKIIPVKLSIPDDNNLTGRKFHAWVFSYTSGQAVGVGLKSRILIRFK
ncbi:MAG: hypothetical protein HY810_10505 [Candidatus Omnitrophica bacterium]|nr:hypothetical protein [Candidatus Omnitrophota bacterium]